MGTKNNPSKFDCYADVNPDEPMFVLRGSDPFAWALVSLWAQVRKGLKNPDDAAKIADAENCQWEMMQWCEEQAGREPQGVIRALPQEWLVAELFRRGFTVVPYQSTSDDTQAPAIPAK